jgi:hypothetical protein
MAQSGFTPIVLYASGTATNTPSSGNLANGELAINYADGKLFYKDSSGVVQVLATKGGVGTSSTTQVLYNSSGLTVGSANLTFDGNSLTLGNGTYSTTSKLNGSSSGSGGGTALYFQNTGTTNFAIGNYSTIIGGAYNIDATYYLGTANNHLFYTNTTEKMRIDSSGNLLVGVTSASYSSANRGVVNIGGSSGGLLALTSSTNKSYLFQSGDALSIENDTTTGSIIFGTNASTERMRIDSSGNVGIGTSTIVRKLDVRNTSADYQLHLGDVSSTTLGYELGRENTGGLFKFYGNQTGATGYIFSGVDGERMRIDTSGNLLVGTTTLPTINVKGAALANYSNQGRLAVGTTLSSADLAYFYSSTALAGSISVNGSVCTFTSLSDYRLKEDVTPMTGALAKVQALKPVTYKWKEDGSNGQGFIAHELQEIVPECVAGVKDEVDAEGNPKYQGVDTSFLVATLTAAIQEQQAMITNLSAQVTALQLQIDTMQ